MLAAVAVLALSWAAVVALAGGIAIRAGGWQLVSRDPWRALAAAAICAAIALALLGAVESRRLARAMTGGRERAPARIAALAAAAVLVAAIAWNTRAAGGSDSSCYVLQAEAFAQGRVTLAAPLRAPGPGIAAAALAPIGFVPSPAPPHDAVPICAPGLALAMTPAYFVHRDAVFLVVPLFAALAVWCTFLLGRALDDDLTGGCAAVLFGCSPIFLYQSVQPMSDVPASALWLTALVALVRASPRSVVVAGLAASGAVLMRPNMALLVVPLLALLPRRRGAWWRFVGAGLPGAAIFAILNTLRYGSALVSGYGSTEILFSAAHAGPNLARYSQWLLETQSFAMVLALGAPFSLWRRRRRLALVTSMAVLLTCATYLAYTVFDDWWYLRFLLPALPVLIVFTVVTLRVLAERMTARPGWPLPGRAGWLVVAASAGLAMWFIGVAANRQVFGLQALEARFRVTGAYAARALPANAIVLSVQQSGSIRFYGRRGTLAWDAVAPDALDDGVAWLRAQGYAPLIALEDEEDARFRARFPSQAAGQLDWPPVAEVRTPVRVRIYDPAARVVFLRGGGIATEHIWK